MSRSRHERLSDLFQKAVELSPAGRDEFLERECADDPGLRAELDALLALDLAAGEGDATERLAVPPSAAPTETDDETMQYPSGWKPDTDLPSIAGYRIVREIGSGGAGSVFEAHDERMNRRVALKVLHGPAWLSAKAGRRFEREAWITGKLNHPHIVKVHERGTSDGIDYYSMELVQGGSLHDVIGRMRQGRRDDRLGLEFGSRAYIEWAIGQVVFAARALDYAHRQGVVHRDVKPLNLLLGTDPVEVKVADFGIAMDEEATRLTTEGQILGTVRYMAPEQIRGKPGEIDRRVDVHALGVTLFEMLTLEFPYRGRSYEHYMRAVLTDVARRPSRLNSRIGRDLETVIGKSLEKERQDRYDSAGEFADDLDNVLHSHPIRAHPPATVTRAVKWVRRKPVHAALLAVLILGAPTGGFVGYRMVEQGRLLQGAALEGMERQLTSLGLTLRYPEIVELASSMLEIDPGHPDALRSRALARFNLSLQEEALGDVEAWITIEPEKAGPHRLKSYFLRRLGRDADAAKIESHADTLSSGDRDDLYFQGLLALDARDHEQVLELMSEVLRTRQRPDAIRARAVALARLRNYEAAIGEYRILAGIDPKDHTAHSDMGRIFMLWGKPDEAEASLVRAKELNPDDPIVYERLTDNALRLGHRAKDGGDGAKALTLFRQAETHARDGLLRSELNPWLYLNLGLSLIERHRLEPEADGSFLLEAEKHLGKTRDLAESQPGRVAQALKEKAAFNQCDVLIEARRLDLALSACRQVARDYSEDPVAHYNLAAVHALAGRTDEAFAELEEDLRLGDTEYGYLLSDANFESLREDPRFKQIVDTMKQNAQAEGR